MAETEPLLAYFSVCKDTEGAVAGGMLLVNKLGRPTEFHCTAPVSVNRAQQILYGAALESFIIADQVCTALIGKLSASPLFLLVQPVAALAIRQAVPYPVVAVQPDNDPTESPENGWLHVTCEERPLRVLAGKEFAEDVNVLRQWLADTPLEFDPLEPFERIHLALAEARKAA